MAFRDAFASTTGGRKLAVLSTVLVLFALPSACGRTANGSGCFAFTPTGNLEFEADVTDGFDDLASPGAAVGIAIDEEDEEVAMIVAFRFASATTERTYDPTCDTESAIQTYDYGELDNVTTPVSVSYPFLTAGITDTNGVGNMDHTVNVLLVINEDDGARWFLAVDGSITLFRTLGAMAENRVTGDLDFVEITQPSVGGLLVPGGEVLRIEDIDFTWDTTTQPM